MDWEDKTENYSLRVNFEEQNIIIIVNKTEMQSSCNKNIINVTNDIVC